MMSSYTYYVRGRHSLHIPGLTIERLHSFYISFLHFTLRSAFTRMANDMVLGNPVDVNYEGRALIVLS